VVLQFLHFTKFFFYSDSFHPGDYHAKKNKSEKTILSVPKTAATLIIAATLNTAPTVNTRGKKYLQNQIGALFYEAKNLPKVD
jgi:hypothetical protein